MDDRIDAERVAQADSRQDGTETRAPYEVPVLLTVQGSLTTLLGSAAECTVVEPPDQDFA